MRGRICSSLMERLPVKEAAELLGVRPVTLYKAIQRGEVRAVKVRKAGAKRARLWVTRRAVAEVLARGYWPLMRDGDEGSE